MHREIHVFEHDLRPLDPFCIGVRRGKRVLDLIVGDNAALLQIDEAKQVCARCKVSQACLQWALESGQDSGVWGGLSEDERRALKRRGARVGASA